MADNAPSLPSLEIDNGDVGSAGAFGTVHISGLQIEAESPTQPAVKLHRAAVEISDLSMQGNHTGLDWRGDNNANHPSFLNNSVLSGTGCTLLTNHDALGGHGNRISTDCTGDLTLINSHVNWSGLTDDRGNSFNPTVLNVDATSTLHLHQPVNVSYSSAVLATGAEMDVAWDLTIWTVNNVSNGIPGAFNNVSFSAFEPTISPIYTDDVGRVFLPDFIGQRWTVSGASSLNTADVLCGYDGQSNSTSAVLDQDRVVYCILPLDNQAPFIHWTTPEDGGIFPLSPKWSSTLRIHGTLTTTY